MKTQSRIHSLQSALKSIALAGLALAVSATAQAA
jgi:hypothetical protein